MGIHSLDELSSDATWSMSVADKFEVLGRFGGRILVGGAVAGDEQQDGDDAFAASLGGSGGNYSFTYLNGHDTCFNDLYQ